MGATLDQSVGHCAGRSVRQQSKRGGRHTSGSQQCNVNTSAAAARLHVFVACCVNCAVYESHGCTARRFWTRHTKIGQRTYVYGLNGSYAGYFFKSVHNRVARYLELKNTKLWFKKGKVFDFTIQTSIDSLINSKKFRGQSIF